MPYGGYKPPNRFKLDDDDTNDFSDNESLTDSVFRINEQNDAQFESNKGTGGSRCEPSAPVLESGSQWNNDGKASTATGRQTDGSGYSSRKSTGNEAGTNDDNDNTNVSGRTAGGFETEGRFGTDVNSEQQAIDGGDGGQGFGQESTGSGHAKGKDQEAISVVESGTTTGTTPQITERREPLVNLRFASIGASGESARGWYATTQDAGMHLLGLRETSIGSVSGASESGLGGYDQGKYLTSNPVRSGSQKTRSAGWFTNGSAARNKVQVRTQGAFFRDFVVKS